MGRVVDNEGMIINPVIYARDKKLRSVGEKGYFKSSGWEIKGTVQSVRTFNDDPFITSDGWYVYQIQEYTKLVYVGIERSEEEEIEYQKKLDRERQLKLKFGK